MRERSGPSVSVRQRPGPAVSVRQRPGLSVVVKELSNAVRNVTMTNTKATAKSATSGLWREMGKTVRLAIRSWGATARLAFLIGVVATVVALLHHYGVVI